MEYCQAGWYHTESENKRFRPPMLRSAGVAMEVYVWNRHSRGSREAILLFISDPAMNGECRILPVPRQLYSSPTNISHTYHGWPHQEKIDLHIEWLSHANFESNHPPMGPTTGRRGCDPLWANQWGCNYLKGVATVPKGNMWSWSVRSLLQALCPVYIVL